MRQPQDPIAVVTAALVAISALALVCPHPCATRGRIGHAVMCVAMAAMLAPAYDPLGPLVWALLLGGLGCWLADTPVPLARRLPLIADLTLMVVLLLSNSPAPGMDSPAATAAAHHHAPTAGPDWMSLPILAVTAWALLRVHLWRAGRGTLTHDRSTTSLVAGVSMTSAMTIMGVTHALHL